MLLYDKKLQFICILVLVSISTTLCYRETRAKLPYSHRYNWRHKEESINPLRADLISQENFDKTFDLVFRLMDQNRKLFQLDIFEFKILKF